MMTLMVIMALWASNQELAIRRKARTRNASLIDLLASLQVQTLEDSGRQPIQSKGVDASSDSRWSIARIPHGRWRSHLSSMYIASLPPRLTLVFSNKAGELIIIFWADFSHFRVLAASGRPHKIHVSPEGETLLCPAAGCPTGNGLEGSTGLHCASAAQCCPLFYFQ